MIEYLVINEWHRSAYKSNLDLYFIQALNGGHRYLYRYRVGKNYTILPNGVN